MMCPFIGCSVCFVGALFPLMTFNGEYVQQYKIKEGKLSKTKYKVLLKTK